MSSICKLFSSLPSLTNKQHPNSVQTISSGIPPSSSYKGISKQDLIFSEELSKLTWHNFNTLVVSSL